MSKQKQAVEAAKASTEVANSFSQAVRDALVIANHATATGLATDMATIATELGAHQNFMAGDKLGAVPAGTVVNPKMEPEMITRYVEQRDENGIPVITDDVQQYDEVEVRNPKYNPDAATHVFQSTTGMQIDPNNQEVVGTGVSISTLLLRLTIAGAINLIKDQEIEFGGEAITFGDAVEQASTI